MKEEEDGSVSLEVGDYEEVISKALSAKEIELLQLLYTCENKSATAKELAKLISPKNPAVIIANQKIGRVGKSIASFFDLVYDTSYLNENGESIDGRGGWYNFVSDGYYSKVGWTLLPELQRALENLNLVNSRFIEERLPTEEQPFNEEVLLKEGKAIKIVVNKYERNQRARIACIETFGCKCYVCGFDFEKIYGDIAKDFIHVHHIKPISEIREEYIVNPITDLIPLCPNCHSVVHLAKPELSINELKNIILLNSKR